MATEKRRILNAYVSEETYRKFMNGEAISNNGLRSPKGNFIPDQPEFSPRNEYSEQLKAAFVAMVISTTNYGLYQIVLPSCKHLWFEKFYPYLEEKIDIWKNQKKSPSESEKTQEYVLENSCPAEYGNNVINLDDYRKRA